MDPFALKDTPLQWQDLYVTGAGTDAANGRYIFAGYVNLYPYWQKDTDSNWQIFNDPGGSDTLIYYLPQGTYYKASVTVDSCVGATFNPNLGAAPAPSVTYANSSLVAFQYAKQLQARPVFYNVVDTLWGGQIYMGAFNALILAASPNMAAGSITAFWYAWNMLENGAPGKIGYYHGNESGTGNYPPLIIRGREAIRGLCIAGADPSNDVFISAQLLTGSV